jgi:hypothetical protein
MAADHFSRVAPSRKYSALSRIIARWAVAMMAQWRGSLAALVISVLAASRASRIPPP